MSILLSEKNNGPASKELPSDWLAMPFRCWCKKVGISPSHGYAMAAKGKIKITKIGNRSLIMRAEHDRLASGGVR